MLKLMSSQVIENNVLPVIKDNSFWPVFIQSKNPQELLSTPYFYEAINDLLIYRVPYNTAATLTSFGFGIEFTPAESIEVLMPLTFYHDIINGFVYFAISNE